MKLEAQQALGIFLLDEDRVHCHAEVDALQSNDPAIVAVRDRRRPRKLVPPGHSHDYSPVLFA